MRWEYVSRWAYVSFVLGLLLCLICAFLISEGNILGENKGWAIVIGIVGMGLIGASAACILGNRPLPK